MSLEEHQPCIRLVRLSQDEQNNSLCVLVNKNPKFLSGPGNTGRRPVGFGCQPKRILATDIHGLSSMVKKTIRFSESFLILSNSIRDYVFLITYFRFGVGG